MTAMITGAKTRAGVLSVDAEVLRGDWARVEGHRLTTLLERAEHRGLATGVVSTAAITHATPAAGYAHVPDRNWEDDSRMPEAARAADFPDVARQLVGFEAGDGIDIALGGGRQRFLPNTTPDPEYPDRTGTRLDGRNVAEAWQQARPASAWVWNREQLEALDWPRTDYVLGLFEPDHMQFEAHRANDGAGEPSLAEMTRLALRHLERRSEQGYVLVVEAGRIDHGHHSGSAYLALHDTIELSEAVAATLASVDLSETLVIVTADHDHTFTTRGLPDARQPDPGARTRQRSPHRRAHERATARRPRPALHECGLSERTRLPRRLDGAAPGARSASPTSHTSGSRASRDGRICASSTPRRPTISRRPPYR